MWRHGGIDEGPWGVCVESRITGGLVGPWRGELSKVTGEHGGSEVIGMWGAVWGLWGDVGDRMGHRTSVGGNRSSVEG